MTALALTDPLTVVLLVVACAVSVWIGYQLGLANRRRCRPHR